MKGSLPDVFGKIVEVDMARPAANTDYTDVVIPDNTRRRLLGFAASLVTDANAVNRRVVCEVENASDVVLMGGMSYAAHIASQTVLYLGVVGVSRPAASTVNVTHFENINPLPLPGGSLRATDEVSFRIVNIQAGDRWAGVGKLIFEEWIEE